MTRSLPPDYPPVLYVPCAEPVTDPDELRVEYRTTRDGREALLVYSALDRLRSCCGAGQPWFLMPTVKLDELHRVRPFDLPEIKHWLEVFVRRFFANQFKRSALPNGPKVSAGGTLSPRGDWRMPSDASAAAWLAELDAHVPA